MVVCLSPVPLDLPDLPEDPVAMDSPEMWEIPARRVRMATTCSWRASRSCRVSCAPLDPQAREEPRESADDTATPDIPVTRDPMDSTERTDLRDQWEDWAEREQTESKDPMDPEETPLLLEWESRDPRDRTDPRDPREDPDPEADPAMEPAPLARSASRASLVPMEAGERTEEREALDLPESLECPPRTVPLTVECSTS